jgi:hypothetical protein
MRFARLDGRFTTALAMLGWTLVCTFALAWGLPVASDAQPLRKMDYSDEVTVSEVQPQQRRVVVRDDVDTPRKFIVDETTRILRGSDPMDLDDLTPGMRVVVDAVVDPVDKAGDMHAERIVVVKEKEPGE